uniref:Craniofacial development protein 2-like n=1 Tax=Nicotiana tabacum TaxID=4097 RepID=A0A1S4BMH9_TOBAC|nr:PREDICTED: uncharacterized protein LOC107809874 [Nicotiana tabacum]
MTIKVVVRGFTLNVISVYALQVGLDEEVKRRFWDNFAGLFRGIPYTEKLIIGGDTNGHIMMTSGGYDSMHDGFSFGDRNRGGTSLLDCVKAFDLVITNSYFSKKRNI